MGVSTAPPGHDHHLGRDCLLCTLVIHIMDVRHSISCPCLQAGDLTSGLHRAMARSQCLTDKGHIDTALVRSGTAPSAVSTVVAAWTPVMADG